jgi:Insertion element 4 transposase N-terminal
LLASRAATIRTSLPDRIALGVLTRLVTRELVEDVLAATARKEQRRRLLLARVTVYFVLALALFTAIRMGRSCGSWWAFPGGRSEKGMARADHLDARAGP